MSTRQRLDEALVARGLYPSRSRARDAVLRGTVRIDGVVALIITASVVLSLRRGDGAPPAALRWWPSAM